MRNQCDADPCCLITADHKYSCPWPADENPRQAAHEAREAAIGLEIARDIGDDFVACREFMIDIRQAQACCFVGGDGLRVDALVDDA